jgi:tetratricopeptide (TPR) repeat protein
MHRSLLVHLLPGLVLAALMLSPALASAQAPPAKPGATDEGKAHFQRGVALFQENDFRAALVEFRRAYELGHNYKVLYNIGQADFELQDYAGALRAFQSYLEGGGGDIDASRRASVQEDIKKLGARVARVEVKSSVEGAEVLVDDVVIGKTPLPEAILVSIGRRKITLQRGGTVSAPRFVDVAGGDNASVSLELAEAQAPAPGPVVAPPPGTPVAPAAPVAPSPPSRTGMWASLGVTGALAVGWAVTGVLALQAHSAAETDLNTLGVSSSTVSSAHSKTMNLALVADILGGTTIAMAGVTIALGVTSGKTSKPDAAALTLGPRGAALSGRF